MMEDANNLDMVQLGGSLKRKTGSQSSSRLHKKFKNDTNEVIIIINLYIPMYIHRCVYSIFKKFSRAFFYKV